MNMSEVKGKDAYLIKSICHKFNESFTPTFKDSILRASIWTEPGDDDMICIQLLAADDDGNYSKLEGYYQVSADEFFFSRKMSRAFVNSKQRDNAIKSFIAFIADMTQIRLSINKIYMDLGVRSYVSSIIKIANSPSEEGSVDIYICAYTEQAKDMYCFCDAKQIVSKELASF